jgi:hypothetical protein
VLFDFLYSFCLEYLSFSKEFSKILSYLHTGLHVKYPVFLSEFHQTLTILTDLQKSPQISHFMEIRPVRTGGTSGQTHRHDESNSCFFFVFLLQFCNFAILQFCNFANTLNERYSPGHSPCFTESPKSHTIAGRWLTRICIVSYATLNLQRGTKSGVNRMMETNY